MSSQPDTILADALKLPLTVRAYLAERLIESLDTADDAALSSAWREEIMRRCREVEEGKVTLLAAEEVFAEAYRSIE